MGVEGADSASAVKAMEYRVAKKSIGSVKRWYDVVQCSSVEAL
jgi:hypothetical protein